MCVNAFACARLLHVACVPVRDDMAICYRCLDSCRDDKTTEKRRAERDGERVKERDGASEMNRLVYRSYIAPFSTSYRKPKQTTFYSGQLRCACECVSACVCVCVCVLISSCMCVGCIMTAVHHREMDEEQVR